ncbi:PREDICTED: inversin [Nanorana parkeri]|uniref:inversin n=1 Tax=Nanorana parkeri TaxID=125878 RepID=UPI000854F17C|nr:PREDICTED: inversin [Nanorana parkeri]
MNSPPKGSSLASPVHAAAVTGDKATLLRLIGSNSDLLDQEDQLGRTPLMYSVLGDRRACAEALLRCGAQVNRLDRSGRTALHLAAQTGNHRLLKLLLSRRADCTHRDLRDITALHLSTRHQDTRCLALLLKHTPPGQVDAQDQRKQTALHWSAYYNRPRHVRLLVRHGSNIGIPDLEGKIPLHWAAGHKDPEAALTVRCLLEAAPTESLLNWQDYEGRTPLHLAVGDGNQEVVRLLTSYRGCNVTPYDNLFRTPLHWAALLGHTPIANLLLERNRSPNIPSDSQGATPLHYAAQGNCPDTVRVLLAHPSVRDEADLEGRTAFMWAAGKGSDETLKVMLELDSELEINRTDKYGGTALHAASLSGHISTIRILLQNGAQVDAADVMKHTPLFRACEMGHREVIYTLIKGGAKVHLVDKDGRSPLHWAALGGNANVCQILIENNINPNAQDYEGRTPLQCAAYGGYIGCMEVLMENKADPNIQDKNGRTALHWSCNNGYLDAVKLLLHYNAFPNQMESTEERYTPLDYALLGGHQEVIQFMLEHGALSIAAIQDIAASKIQAVYKGHKVRRAFRDRKNLLMKHEQLRKDAAAKKREGVSKRKTKCNQPREDGQNEDKQTNTSERFMDKEEQHSHSDIQQKSTTEEKRQESAGKTKIKEHRHQSRTGHASPRPREVCEASNQSTPSRISHVTSSPSELFEKEYREEGQNLKKEQCKRSSRHRKENCSTLIHEERCQSQNDYHRVSHKEIKEGSQFSLKAESSTSQCAKERDTAGKVISKEQIIEKPIKGPRAPRNKKTDMDMVTQIMASSSITESRSHRRNKESNGIVIQVTSNGDNSAKHKEISGRLHSERKSSSARAGQPNATGIQATCEEERPSRKTKQRTSSSHSRHSKQADIERTGVNCSPTSLINASITLAMPRDKLRTGHSLAQWQQLDIELIPLEARLQLVEREKARKQLFQRKNQAAVIIQRAWRKHRIKKRGSIIRTVHPPRIR